jgi:type IV pilus assembly protein PilE
VITHNKKTLVSKGFSLIELMISIAILGIISAIAIPSYLGSVQKSRRNDAAEALLQLAVAQEQFYAQQGTYTTNISTSAGLNKGSTTSRQGYYNLTATAGPTNSIKTSFILVATATAGQEKDTDCAVFSINSHNKQSAKNKAGTTTTSCW